MYMHCIYIYIYIYYVQDSSVCLHKKHLGMTLLLSPPPNHTNMKVTDIVWNHIACFEIATYCCWTAFPHALSVQLQTHTHLNYSSKLKFTVNGRSTHISIHAFPLGKPKDGMILKIQFLIMIIFTTLPLPKNLILGEVCIRLNHS